MIILSLFSVSTRNGFELVRVGKHWYGYKIRLAISQLFADTHCDIASIYSYDDEYIEKMSIILKNR